MTTKSISSPVPVAWYPTLAVFMLAIGLVVTASFFIGAGETYLPYLHPKSESMHHILLVQVLNKLATQVSGFSQLAWAHRKGNNGRPVLVNVVYEATSSRRNRSLVKELTTGAVASVFLGFGSLFLLLSSGIYV